MNPWIVAFWSFAFPGCGNLVQGRIGKGIVLVCWELLVNTNANINLSIMYSLLGQFELAKQVVNPRWFLFYVSMYVYAMWDSYRGTVDLNKMSLLSIRENKPLKPLVIGSLDVHFMDKRVPWLAAVLSLLSPGLGHLYVHKVIPGLFFIGWTILVMVMSNALPAVHYAMIGEFGLSLATLDMQWLMYLPSIYGYVLYDTYMLAVEYNNLYDTELSRYCREHYQHPDFQMPI